MLRACVIPAVSTAPGDAVWNESATGIRLPPDAMPVRDGRVARMRMHADEVVTDADLVRRLLAQQFPHWADLPVVPVTSSGTDHDIYRLGDDLAVRLPRIGWATGQAAKEARWLPRLAPALPAAVP